MSSSLYHLDSLAIAAVVISSLVLLCLAPAARRFPREFQDSVRLWTLGTGLVVLSDALSLSVMPLRLSGALLTAVATTGAALWLQALRRFDGRALLRWPWLLVSASVALAVTVTSYRASAILSALSLGVLYVAIVGAAERLRSVRASAGKSVLAATFGTMAAVMAARLTLAVLEAPSAAPAGFTGPGRAALYLLASMGPIAGSLSFVLMCGDRLSDELRRLATFDPLTGVRNRRTFLEAAERALLVARRREEPVALVALDLDHFKRINDLHGHPAGDRALVEVAAVLATGVRVGDEAGRLGGEEFAVLMPGADARAAEAVAERLRLAIAARRVEESPLSVSAGVAVATAEDSVETLLARADAALYDSKRTGRNRVTVA